MKHLLSTRDLDRETAIHILDVAEDMAQTADREVRKLLRQRIQDIAMAQAGSLGVVADVYLRDNVGDDGSVPTAGAISASPDIIVLPATVPDPNADYRSFVRSTTCQNGRFEFSGLPDGAWFIISPVSAGSAAACSLAWISRACARSMPRPRPKTWQHWCRRCSSAPRGLMPTSPRWWARS